MFKNSFIKIFIGLVLISSGVMLYASVYDENLFSGLTGRYFTPFQELISETWKNFNEIVPDFGSYKEMENENALLKEEIAKLREMSADYYELKKKNVQYEKYLGFKQERSDIDFLHGMVISRDPLDLFYDFVVNKGSDAGVCEGDSVITENGFVGCICRVDKKTSKVKTIFSPDIKLGAGDSISGDIGVISGDYKLCLDGCTALTLISAQNSMKEGDMITTTGLSGLYPKNLPIGKVKQVNYDSLNSSHYAVIEPFEDIKKVKDVLIIVSFLNEGEISGEAVQSN